MTYTRESTRVVDVAGVRIGGGNPIVIQSMTNTDTRDATATVAQIERLAEAGCELVRVAVPDMAAAEAITEIKRWIKLPLAADIHFDYRLAIRAMEAGADKLRINPGNIAGARADGAITANGLDRIRRVADTAKARSIPIRIGVNSGSLEPDILEKNSGVTANGLVESALRHVRLLEDMDFGQIVISLKASRVPMALEAYERLAAQVDYPLHVGITEAGTDTVRSAAGIGAILSRGIGDTIRVSLTGDPVREIPCAREILQALELRVFGPTVVSCPTCGRTEIDLPALAAEVERVCAGLDKPIRVAVMGCAVNGPGEAREADIGIAGGKGVGLIFTKGKKPRKVPETELLQELSREIDRL